MFVLSLARNAAEDNGNSFSHYYIPGVKLKDFNVLIDGSFFDLPVKNEEEEAYKKIIEMNRNNG